MLTSRPHPRGRAASNGRYPCRGRRSRGLKRQLGDLAHTAASLFPNQRETSRPPRLNVTQRPISGLVLAKARKTRPNRSIGDVAAKATLSSPRAAHCRPPHMRRNRRRHSFAVAAKHSGARIRSLILPGRGQLPTRRPGGVGALQETAPCIYCPPLSAPMPGRCADLAGGCGAPSEKQALTSAGLQPAVGEGIPDFPAASARATPAAHRPPGRQTRRPEAGKEHRPPRQRDRPL